MGDLVAWIKENLRKTHLKEFIMTHTGLAPPAFFAVVAVAAAGTALTVSAVSSFVAPPKKNERDIDTMLNNVMNSSLYPNNQREVEQIPTIFERPKEEEEEEATEEVKPPTEEVKPPAGEAEVTTEEVEAPEKEETTETTAPTETDVEDTTTLEYVNIENTSTD